MYGYGDRPFGMANNVLGTVMVDWSNTKWIGGGGIMDAETGAVFYNSLGSRVFTRRTTPLPEGNVYAIAIDSAGSAWFGTREGIAVLKNADKISSVAAPKPNNNATRARIYPNPSSGEITLEYEISADR